MAFKPNSKKKLLYKNNKHNYIKIIIKNNFLISK